MKNENRFIMVHKGPESDFDFVGYQKKYSLLPICKDTLVQIGQDMINDFSFELIAINVFGIDYDTFEEYKRTMNHMGLNLEFTNSDCLILSKDSDNPYPYASITKLHAIIVNEKIDIDYRSIIDDDDYISISKSHPNNCIDVEVSQQGSNNIYDTINNDSGIKYIYILRGDLDWRRWCSIQIMLRMRYLSIYSSEDYICVSRYNFELERN